MVQVGGVIGKCWSSRLCRMLAAAGLAVMLGVGAGRCLVGAVYVVEGASMEPTYPPGTHLYGTPIATPLERGDVVLLKDGKAGYAVKRIIGLPGESVQLWRGCVFVNRQLLVEPYLPKHTYTCPVDQARRGAAFVLRAREYFLLGDNRLHSEDSRVYGPVARSQIKRRVPPLEGFVCGYLGPYTLPAYGTTIMRPLTPAVIGTRASL
ncbi:MAG TPA: signal peptidase I [Verrucomicrobiota bacterium]|nr:signal peptidase I [Verrucomicrobiota bacterium]